jgi:SAM-dependent methyltransferase
MPCASYADPRLAAVYDPLNPLGDDHRFYVELAGTGPLTILDVGSGTGRLACDLMLRGHKVTGVEPARGMIGIARSRPGGSAVTWINSGAAELSLTARFDLIIMTGHVFQVFLEDDEIRAVLANLRRHLASGGRLAFETRNALVKEWETWNEENYEPVAGNGNVEVRHRIASVEGPLVTFETHFRFAADDTVIAPHTLRFMTKDELDDFLAETGFTDITWYGDWDGSPASDTSPEIIVIAS